MKTKFILLAVMIFGSLNYLHAREISSDSVGTSLQEKIRELDLHVKSLQAEIRSLKITDSLHRSELLSLKNSLRKATPRKLIINRIGSKQASMQ